MSLEHLYVDSDGDTAEFPRFYRQQEEKLAKLQHVLSGMKRGSKRYERQKRKIAKLHEKTAAQRRDFLDKLSYNLAYHYDVICIEDLNMHAMAQSLHLGKSVMDVGWGIGACLHACWNTNASVLGIHLSKSTNGMHHPKHAAIVVQRKMIWH